MIPMKKGLLALALAFAMALTASPIFAAGSKTQAANWTLVAKQSTKKVKVTSKVKTQKKVVNKFNKLAVNKKAGATLKAYKGAKVSKSKLYKLYDMKRYTRGKKSTKNNKLTLKGTLPKKYQAIYFIHYVAKEKKWYLTKAKVNKNKKTISATLKRLGTVGVVYTK